MFFVMWASLNRNGRKELRDDRKVDFFYSLVRISRKVAKFKKT